MNCPFFSCPEPLEPRIAPATISVDLTDLVVAADGKSARWSDVDGDHVLLTSSKPVLDRSDFVFLQPQSDDLGFQLARLDLVNDPAQGATLTFKSTRNPAVGGDGFVDIGWIDALNSDLAKISVDGDLGRLTVGDANIETQGLGSIVTFAAGSRGLSTQEDASASVSPSNDWLVYGKLGSVTVKGNFFAALSTQRVDQPTQYASIGSVSILGDLVGSTGSTNVPGGALGYISAPGAIGTVKIGGSVFGGDSVGAGSIISATSIASVSIGGSLIGSDHDYSGSIYSGGKIGSVSIKQNLAGGFSRTENGATVTPYAAGSVGSAYADGVGLALGKITIGGSELGGDGFFSGSIFTRPESGGKIGTVTIGGALSGSAEFVTENNQQHVLFTGIYSDSTLGAVKVGSIIGSSPVSPVHIVARGVENPLNAAQALAIASVTVARGVQYAEILAGHSEVLSTDNPDVQIGAVKVGNSWIASSLVAGTTRGSNFFFGDDVEAAPTGVLNNAIASRIASVTIGGFVYGYPGTTDHFAIQAEQLGAVKIGPSVLPLHANGGSNVPDYFVIGASHDTVIREV